MKRKILLTGGAGFIGSNFTNFWHVNYPNDEIVIIDKLTYAGNLDNISIPLNSSNVEFIQGDITDAALIDYYVKKVNLIFHFAAETHITRSLFDSREFVTTDVLGTQNLLSAVVRNRNNIEKFVHVSSSEVYGTALTEQMSEFHPLNPLSPYAAAKCGADRLVYSFIRSYNIPAIIIRPFNNYGPNQHLEKLIPRFITSGITNHPMIIHGDGLSVRDFMYVEDTCKIIHKLIELNVDLSSTGYAINLATGSSLSVLEISNKIKSFFPQYSSQTKFTSDRPGQVVKHVADISELSKIINIKEIIPFGFGIEKTLNWYKSHENWWLKQWSSREIEITLQDGTKVIH